jgi:hypothetical protein
MERVQNREWAKGRERGCAGQSFDEIGDLLQHALSFWHEDHMQYEGNR